MKAKQQSHALLSTVSCLAVLCLFCAVLCSTVPYSWSAAVLDFTHVLTCNTKKIFFTLMPAYAAALEKGELSILLVLQALPLLSSAILLLLIFVFLFGVAGIQLFQNAAHQTCVNLVDGSYPDPALTENSDEWGCGHRHCPSNFTCTVGPCQQMCYSAWWSAFSAEPVFPVYNGLL